MTTCIDLYLLNLKETTGIQQFGSNLLHTSDTIKNRTRISKIFSVLLWSTSVWMFFCFFKKIQIKLYLVYMILRKNHLKLVSILNIFIIIELSYYITAQWSLLLLDFFFFFFSKSPGVESMLEIIPCIRCTKTEDRLSEMRVNSWDLKHRESREGQTTECKKNCPTYLQ